jgi:ABC-type Fe3+-citrate transport system substrate-binding protein
MVLFDELRKDQFKVWEISTLGRADDGQAKKILDDVAKQVQPIMRKRQVNE